jgi:hypothetical protein
MKNFELEPIPVLKRQEKEKMQASTAPRDISDSLLSVMVTEEVIEKVKDYAYWERLTQKEVILQALEQFLANKAIKSRPEEVKNRVKVGRKKII